MASRKIRLIPLGGVGEIGKNMAVIECDGQGLVIDCGLMFPEEEMLGVDIVLPDFSYLTARRDRLRGIVLTHGHEDHVGALPYVLRELPLPVWGTKLTLGLAKSKFNGASLPRKVRWHEVTPERRLRLGPFDIEFFRVCHSIPDGVGLIMRTARGTVVHSGDFKLDPSPIDGRVTEFAKLARAGLEGVLLLLSDCTNVEKPGYTPSERLVGERLDGLLGDAQGRVIVATFASNIHRVQQVINFAVGHGRKVAVAGRSLENSVAIATELGYLNCPRGALISMAAIDKLPPREVVIITTGAQGEPLSALTRMAGSGYRQVTAGPGDTVIMSASPIPGNEDLIFRTVNQLFRRGAEVIYEPAEGVHVSGHGNQEEIKFMLNLLRPKYLVPIHGEARHQARMVDLAASLGMDPSQVFALEVGDVLEVGPRSARVAGKVNAGSVLVDGLGVGDVGPVVLRDRRHLAEDGIVIVVVVIDQQSGQLMAGPDVITRGFVYAREAEDFLEEARATVRQTVTGLDAEEKAEWATVKSHVRAALNRFIYERIKRRPMVIPIIMEV